MKKTLFLILSICFIISCGNKAKESERNALKTKELLQGAWYTTTIEVNNQIIYTKEHPEALSSFVFKDDNVKLIQMAEYKSENVGNYKVSNDTIYIYDIIANNRVMTIKINKISKDNLDITVLDDQNIKMKLERMKD